jgi:hypothetical protein
VGNSATTPAWLWLEQQTNIDMSAALAELLAGGVSE